VDVVKAKRLRQGDLIGLICPASAPSPSEKIDRAVRYFEKRGYRVVLGEHARARHGYLAGTDAQRASDLNNFIRKKEVRAIFSLRGGYGTPRLLPLIDYAALRRDPKIIAGFSDITALQMALFRKCRLVTFSSPMGAVDFHEKIDPFTEENFWDAVTGKAGGGLLCNPNNISLEMPQLKTSGRLLGGNLSLVVTLLATPYSPNYKNALLVLEEVDEAPYRVDRMLIQLRNGRLFKQISGLILGQFTRCQAKKEDESLTLDELLREILPKELPVVRNLQYGHEPTKLTIPWGVRAEIDSREQAIKLLESAVS